MLVVYLLYVMMKPIKLLFRKASDDTKTTYLSNKLRALKPTMGWIPFQSSSTTVLI